MSSRTPCPSCGQRMTDHARICPACTDVLVLDLQRLGGYTAPEGHHVPGLLDDLLVTATRTGRVPAQGGGGSETPDPGRGDALALWQRASNAVTTWTRVLLEESGYPCDHVTCTTGTRPPCHRWAEYEHACADPLGWLEYRAGAIRRREWADEMLTELDRLVADAERIVDRAPGAFRVPCPGCQRRVPIDPDGTEVIRCLCGEWGTLAWWVEQVAPPMPDALTLVQIPAWLAGRGYAVTHKQARNWADRGQLAPVAAVRRGEERTFRPRDVLALADGDPHVRRVIPASMSL